MTVYSMEVYALETMPQRLPEKSVKTVRHPIRLLSDRYPIDAIPDCFPIAVPLLDLSKLEPLHSVMSALAWHVGGILLSGSMGPDA